MAAVLSFMCYISEKELRVNEKYGKKIIKYEIKGIFFVGLSSLNGKKNILYQHFILKFLQTFKVT